MKKKESPSLSRGEGPRSPDVGERDNLDGGFSKGWGLHFQPGEEYWLDAHTHFEPGTKKTMSGVMEKWFGRLEAFRLGGLIAIILGREYFTDCQKLAEKDPRFNWVFWLPWEEPDAEALNRALDHGAVGLKLHNSSLMNGSAPARVWFEKEWQNVFHRLEKSGRPVIWHVTQRLSVSPYHGGGKDAYWKEGREKGVTITNEDLLADFLEIARRFPGIPFIGAHQLHIGLDRLAEIFEKNRNVYIDSSCGFFTRWADTLYEEDRLALAEFFLRYPDRILFGSDSDLGPENIDEYLFQGFLCHPRFVLQLRLPDEILQKVSHGNAENLFSLEPLPTGRRGNFRP